MLSLPLGLISGDAAGRVVRLLFAWAGKEIAGHRASP